MSTEEILQTRSGSKCELCDSTSELAALGVSPHDASNADHSAYLCQVCREQIEDADKTESNHWRCLNESMWSEVPAVQVLAWRMLNRLKNEGWPQDLLGMLYLDEETQVWAEQGAEGGSSDGMQATVVHRDSNGAVLEAGDTITLIKDLPVKGAGFTAKRGTAVRGISLVADNEEHIEGRVSGQRIVILTKFVKKSN
ncbi:MAG: PhnA protein [bacterium]|nr:PhnA protein [bacterium]